MEAFDPKRWLPVAKWVARKTKVADPSVDREDLVQVAMVAMIEAWSTFDPIRGVKTITYLQQAAYWACYRYARRADPQRAREQGEYRRLASDTYDPLDHAHAPERDLFTTIDFARLVERLPERDAQIVRWLYEGLDGAEIGRRLGITRQRVEQRMHQIRRAA